MLRLSNSYTTQNVLSLRTGGRIGTALTPIINPNNLKIEGWFCNQKYEKGDFILPVSELRDVIAQGLVVNDHESLTHPDDMIRLKDIVNLRFELIGKSVKTESGEKLGKVADYAVEDMSHMIQKLYVNPTLLKGLTQNQFVIDRNAIVEINDKTITVKDASVPASQAVPIPAQA